MKYLSQLSLLLPLAFFLGAAIQYMGQSSDYTIASMIIRDGFILISLILSLPLIYKQKWTSDRNVLRGLRHLFFLVLITSAILFLSENRLASLREQFFDSDFFRINLGDNVLVVSWAFFAIVFILIALGTLRNLIYIKRKKSTAAIFTWLMIFLLLYSLTSLPEYYPDSVIHDAALFKYINYVVLFILINFSVINSFRVGWINYLNKKQKIACFWGGLILVPVQGLFVVQFREINPIVSFSPLLERFIEMGMVFITVYLSISFLALLAHLPTAKLYDRKMQQIQSLHDLSRALSSEFNWTKLVRTIVKLASEVTQAEYAWLELYNHRDGALSLISSKQLLEFERQNWQAERIGPLIEWLKRTKETMICNQVNKNDLVKNIQTWKKDVGSLIAVPMITSDRVVGFLYVGKRFEFGFEQDDAEMLRAFSDQATIAVENARLVEESIVKERLEQELKIAHEAQMKLLPKKMPVIEGIELDAVCVTANEVGGDYYDFFKLDDAKLGIVIGDVSGKGPSAAFYMAEVKGIMEALAKEVLSPEQMLVAANEILYKNFDRKTFISLIYGIIDAKNRSFTFCRAGHCPIFFVHGEKDICQRLEPKGLGVGLDPGPIFAKSLQQERIKLKRGDTLLLYTDGVTDARNRDGDEFGEKGLETALLAVKDQVSIEIKKHIIHTIYSFFDGQNAYDDLTFVIIKAL
ncbi:SpoIIE family protein phosphatase [candidate division KSB1 bacterium]|nr:SpoIIE family protein phosphatase [candidate division KSB1 bacterium]